MLTDTQADKIHTLSRNRTNATEFLNDTIGGMPSNEVDQDDLELLRNLTYTIKTDLQGIELIILNKAEASEEGSRYLEVHRARMIDGDKSRTNLKAV